MNHTSPLYRQQGEKSCFNLDKQERMQLSACSEILLNSLESLLSFWDQSIKPVMSLEDRKHQNMNQNSWSNPNHLTGPVPLRTYIN